MTLHHYIHDYMHHYIHSWLVTSLYNLKKERTLPIKLWISLPLVIFILKLFKWLFYPYKRFFEKFFENAHCDYTNVWVAKFIGTEINFSFHFPQTFEVPLSLFKFLITFLRILTERITSKRTCRVLLKLLYIQNPHLVYHLWLTVKDTHILFFLFSSNLVHATVTVALQLLLQSVCYCLHSFLPHLRHQSSRVEAGSFISSEVSRKVFRQQTGTQTSLNGP